MRLSENRLIAWVVLVVCVLGSIVGLGGGSLVREQKHLMDVFYDGAEKNDTGRYSMDAYLDRAADCAQVMASEVQLYLGNDYAAARSVLDALADFGDDDSLDDRYNAYTRLQKDSDTLYNAMYAAELTDEQRVNFKRAYDDFWGSEKYIRNDPYREMASEFNDSIDSFPANVVAGLLGVEKMNSFGG